MTFYDTKKSGYLQMSLKSHNLFDFESIKKNNYES